MELIQLNGAQVDYLGFRCRDMRDVNVQRKRQFIHVAGGSLVKNTEEILLCWLHHKLPYPLRVISVPYHACPAPPNVEITPRVTGQVLQRWMNESWFHLMPSEYEGYGHSLHESLSCGACVITTNAPPFREFQGCQLYVKSRFKHRYHAAPMHGIDEDALAATVKRAWSYDDLRLWDIARQARAAFDIETIAFRERLAEIFQ
jgi:glycosyltransferase involved in cell wall biosynthesis